MTHITSASIVANAKTVSPRMSRDFAGVARKSVTEFDVPVDMIIEESGFNARMESVENEDHIKSIANSIIRVYGETGNVEHETVRVTPIITEDGREAFVLFDGHCTFKGLMLAKKKGVPVKTVRVLAKQMSEEARKLAILDTNQQKKLNLIERGKVYAEMVETHGWNQKRLAERYSTTQTDISQCVTAYNMPEEMKNLVAQGILSDRDALSEYTRNIRVKGNDEETTANVANFTAKVVEASKTQETSGGKTRVRVKSVKGKAKAKTNEAPKIDEDRLDNLRQSMQVLTNKFADLSGEECAAVPFSATEIAILKTLIANNTVA